MCDAYDEDIFKYLLMDEKEKEIKSDFINTEISETKKSDVCQAGSVKSKSTESIINMNKSLSKCNSKPEILECETLNYNPNQSEMPSTKIDVKQSCSTPIKQRPGMNKGDASPIRRRLNDKSDENCTKNKSIPDTNLCTPTRPSNRQNTQSPMLRSDNERDRSYTPDNVSKKHGQSTCNSQMPVSTYQHASINKHDHSPSKMNNSSRLRERSRSLVPNEKHNNSTNSQSIETVILDPRYDIKRRDNDTRKSSTINKSREYKSISQDEDLIYDEAKERERYYNMSGHNIIEEILKYKAIEIQMSKLSNECPYNEENRISINKSEDSITRKNQCTDEPLLKQIHNQCNSVNNSKQIETSKERLNKSPIAHDAKRLLTPLKQPKLDFSTIPNYNKILQISGSTYDNKQKFEMYKHIWPNQEELLTKIYNDRVFKIKNNLPIKEHHHILEGYNIMLKEDKTGIEICYIINN